MDAPLVLTTVQTQLSYILDLSRAHVAGLKDPDRAMACA